MDTRFKTVWESFERRRDRGEPFDAIVRRARSYDLVAALAAAATSDPVAANAIATELLNRERRAPYLGAFLVSMTTVVLIYVIDFVDTNTWLFIEDGWRAHILVGFSALVSVVSIASWMLWRGRLGSLRAWLRRARSF